MIYIHKDKICNNKMNIKIMLNNNNSKLDNKNSINIMNNMTTNKIIMNNFRNHL